PAAYPYPMIELLDLTQSAPPVDRQEDMKNIRKLEDTLESFGIPARVQRVTHGPSVTRYELGLISSGVNVKRILSISETIALQLAANGQVRIEVPIPGTNLFGIEIPNREISRVSLAEVLTSPEMERAKGTLCIALGKDISGRPVICDLERMPHLLIAGQTGSGKSVCINAIINSLLFRKSPQELRMILIDPKVVELQGYNEIPHLLIPVVTDPQKAAGALAWAVQEMQDRYHKMQSKGVRNIASYNAKRAGDEPALPRIVVIIDELSDLMLACKHEVEDSIIRLAQLARAAGIHVIIATQRPTVNVITGLIKANFPSRISFAVASSIDSRTILDANGAEKLLGSGDMLYYPTGSSTPIRVQGCFVGDQEIRDVVSYIVNNTEPDYDESINELMESADPGAFSASGNGSDDGVDERMGEAIEMVLTDGQASISMLQRRMKIGYARAGRLIDDMALRGIISRSAGSKPRELLISYDQYIADKQRYLS
ncbi:MAG: DNA translocase FtsK, partial [Clostridiales bacterium]|nr:DNA translocase FtsK [Clostridiales bacterium]